MQRHGVHHVLPLHQVCHQGHASGHIQRLNRSQKEHDGVNVPNLHQVSNFQDSKGEHQGRNDKTGGYQQPEPVRTVGDDAAQHGEGQVRDTVGEDHQAKLDGRAGNVQHQQAENQKLHTLGHGLGGAVYPEPTEIAIAKSTKDLKPVP